MSDDTERQIRALEQTNPLREPVLRAAIAALAFAPGSRGLDVGCRIGQQALWLAEATQPDGEVIGLDISPQLLDYAAQRVKNSPYAERISFREGEPWIFHVHHVLGCCAVGLLTPCANRPII